MMRKAIGIDFGGTYIKGALIDTQGQILVKDQITKWFSPKVQKS